ncbi:MAG: hypothetical protein VB959_19165, partial [Rhodospirillales bacterium]
MVNGSYALAAASIMSMSGSSDTDWARDRASSNLDLANFAMGRIADAKYAHMRALRIEPGNAGIQKLRGDFAAQPHVFGQGAI